MIPSLGTDRNRRRGARRRVLLGVYGEERVAGVLAETPQRRALCEFWEGENADRFERCPFTVPDVLQSAQLQRRLAQPDQKDDLV